MGRWGTYFLLNKERDFKRGFGENVVTGESGLALAEGARRGTYYTRVFDSGAEGTKWHRLLLFGSFLEGEVSATVYAAEQKPDFTGKSAWREEEIRTGSRVEFENPADALLFGVTGRYLWIKLSLEEKNGRDVRVERIKICFPQRTWLDYLPEIYREDGESASFLERYLAIFQSVYEEMTERIEGIPERFTASTTDFEALLELADWFAIENRELWNTKQLRYLIRHAARHANIRGTAEYLRELLWLGTGDTAYIVEYGQMQPCFDGGAAEERLKRLYGTNPCEFTILLDGGGKREPEDFYLIEKIVETAKPAYMESRIVVLSPYIFLDKHSYLGINSVLGHYRAFCLDGTCAVPFSVIAGEEMEYEKSEIFSL